MIHSNTLNNIIILVVYALAILFIVAAGAIQVVKGIPVGHLTRDIAATAGVPYYTGAISTVGILMWGTTAAICLFTTFVLRALKIRSGQRKFILQAGIVTVMLLIDDAFMIHENAPVLFGVSNNVVFVVYGLATAYVLYANLDSIGETAHGLLVLSLSLMAAAVLVDKLHDYQILQRVGIESPGMRYLLEDGLKFLGITGWLVYFGSTCFALLTQEERK